MGLPPLVYTDDFLDSPNFREIVRLYEKELEDNTHHVKALVRECKHMIQATEGIAIALKKILMYVGDHS